MYEYAFIKRRKNYMIFCIDWQQAANISTALAALFSLAGIFFVVYQLWQQRRINQADLFLKLFVEFRVYSQIFTISHDWNNSDIVFDPKKDKGMIVAYLGFFESFYHFLQKGILKIEMIDDSFSFSFFSFVNNPQIHQMELSKCWKDYKKIYILYALWKPFHVSQGKNILTQEQIAQGLIELDTLEHYNEVVNNCK